MGEQQSWVRGRYNCNADYVLEQLRAQVEQDRQQANDLFVTHKRQYFIRDSEGVGKKFKVERKDDGADAVHGVVFTVANNQIVVSRVNIETTLFEVLFHLSCEWNERDCRCDIYLIEAGDDMSNERLEIWQVSQRALSDLFFEDDLRW